MTPSPRRRIDRTRPGFLTKLDHLPFGHVLGWGTVAGLGLGALAVNTGAFGVWTATVVGALAVLLALTSQPVWVEPPAREAVPAEPPDIFDMVDIEGGAFLMGSPEDEPGRNDDEERHEVTVSPFLIGATPITRSLYREIMKIEEAPGAGGDEHPVTDVTWFDAVRFCNRASEEAGFEPCYRIEGETVEWVDGNGYRLPTEAEWEYAARAGTETRWSFGDDESRLGDYAWYSGNSGGKAHPVKRRKANPWELFDMHGNVWEWCWDAYGAYQSEAVVDPRGAPEATSPYRVLRGGAFWGEPRWLRSAARRRLGPEGWGRRIGFRCVRIPRRQP